MTQGTVDTLPRHRAQLNTTTTQGMVAGAGSWLITFNHTQETVGEEKKERVNKSSKHTNSKTLPLAGLDLLQVPTPPHQKQHQGGPWVQICEPMEEDICLIQANTQFMK